MEASDTNGQIPEALRKLQSWVERARYMAYDTFDGLSSPYAPFFTLNQPFLKQVWQQGCPAISHKSSTITRH